MKANKTKLHLGCGTIYKKGWTNVDITDIDIDGSKNRVDILCDLDIFPYPFKDKEFDEILMDNVLEHLKDIDKVLKELSRIIKKEGKLTINVPHFTCYGAYREPGHKHHFSLDSLCYYPDFRVIKKRLLYSKNKHLEVLFGWLINLNPPIYERFFCFILPCQECNYEFIEEEGKLNNLELLNVRVNPHQK